MYNYIIPKQEEKMTLKKTYFTALLLFLSCLTPVYASGSMFDEDGNYSGNWKQMTNVSSSQNQKSYSSSSYSSSAWYANNQKQRAANTQIPYSAANYTQMNTVPFRYNTLNYTRVRKVKGGYGDYSAKCSDIGDVSFCH